MAQIVYKCFTIQDFALVCYNCAQEATYSLASVEVSGASTSGPQSATADLNVYTAAPVAPTLTAPADAAANISTNPTFNWAAATQAVTYNIEIATDPSFTNVVDSAAGLSVPSYSPALTLNPNTTYYWRV